MSENCSSTECCTTDSKGNNDHECTMHEELLALADEAWMELLKEKIKGEIEKSGGAHMDKIAKLVADANCAKWGDMIAAKTKCNAYKESLKALMSGDCCK